MPPRFSIVVLTRDEARALPRLLRSLKRFLAGGGEVLIVDTGSTDDTAAIARRAGCRVEAAGTRFESTLSEAASREIDRRFAKAAEGPLVQAGARLFHFGAARQHAGLLARHDFLLQLDASDRALALDLKAIDQWLAAGTVDAFAYDLLSGSVRLRVSRFYDRRRHEWVGRVHETLIATGAQSAAPQRRIECTPAQLLVRHYKNESKARQYLAGLALDVLEHPDNPRWWHYLGRELLYGRRHRSALAALETHAGMDAAWPAERAQSLCFAADCFEALAEPDEAKAACRRAIAVDATRREPLLRLAALHSRHGEFEAAADWAERSLSIPRTSAYPEVDENYTWMPHSILYWSLFWLGRRDAAREHFEICRALAPRGAGIERHARLFPPAG